MMFCKSHTHFFTSGIEYKGTQLKPIDVDADGNCFFSSLVLDPNVPFNNHIDLRANLVLQMNQKIEVDIGEYLFLLKERLPLSLPLNMKRSETSLV